MRWTRREALGLFGMTLGFLLVGGGTAAAQASRLPENQRIWWDHTLDLGPPRSPRRAWTDVRIWINGKEVGPKDTVKQADTYEEARDLLVANNDRPDWVDFDRGKIWKSQQGDWVDFGRDEDWVHFRPESRPRDADPPRKVERRPRDR
jgi:hypothetical protein